MDLDLYNMDLSLFNRDLLVGLEPTSAELKVEQDVDKSLYSTAMPVWTTECSVPHDHNEPAISQTLVTSGVDDVSLSWMDSRVDLLDLIAHESECALAETKLVIGNTAVVKDEDKVFTAVDILQGVADETAQMLTSADYTSIQSDIEEFSKTLDNHVSQNSTDASVDHLFNMLSTNVDCSVDLDLTLGPTSFDLDILSPVTAEDVESILSSEPSSPVAPDNNILLEELPTFKSNSILPQYIDGVGETSFELSPSSFSSSDFSDIDSVSDLLSDNSDYQSDYQVNKSRDTPYTIPDIKLSGPKSKSKRLVDKKAREVERKLRKKQQNKNAALRYRQKKRSEQDVIDQECGELEARNTELRDQVDQMTSEIGYLKNLLAEVYKSRGLILPNFSK